MELYYVIAFAKQTSRVGRRRSLTVALLSLVDWVDRPRQSLCAGLFSRCASLNSGRGTNVAVRGAFRALAFELARLFRRARCSSDCD